MPAPLSCFSKRQSLCLAGLMTLQAFGRRKCALTVMTRAAVFARINGVHRHLLLSFPHLEGPGMALIAGVYLGVELVAERDVPDAFDPVVHRLLKGLHLVALRAFRGGKGLFPVMTRAAVSPLINRVHGHTAHSLLHLKDTHMAFFAAQLCMALVVEPRSEPRRRVHKSFETVAVVAKGPVGLHETVRLETMALVAMVSGVPMDRVRKDPLLPRSEFLIRVAAETGKLPQGLIHAHHPGLRLLHLLLVRTRRTRDSES